MKRSKGFTLIELIVVLAIVAILSSVALAYYGNQVMSSNRTEGRAALTQTAGSLERCRSLYGAYDAANCNVVTAFNTESGHYAISATTLTATTFTLSAAPQNAQAGDADCATLTYTNAGVKGNSGTLPVSDCW